MNILSAALTTLSASPATGLLLAGELAAAAWMVERFARQTIKIRKQNQALAYERTFSRALSWLDHEVYLLLRRSDTFPLYVAGDLPGLTGLTLEDMQRDIACFFQLMSAADAKTLRRMLEKWDRSAPLRMSFHSKREDRWLELCVLPAEDDRYTLLNLRDVSALRQQREEMAAQLEEAQAASQSKTEFLSRMSHEIRTPINGITGLMALTRTRLGGSNPAAEEYLTGRRTCPSICCPSSTTFWTCPASRRARSSWSRRALTCTPWATSCAACSKRRWRPRACAST